MHEEKLRFVDDKLFVYTPLPGYGDNISRVQLVMTKEIFQECYKRWIKSQESENEKSMYGDSEYNSQKNNIYDEIK